MIAYFFLCLSISFSRTCKYSFMLWQKNYGKWFQRSVKAEERALSAREWDCINNINNTDNMIWNIWGKILSNIWVILINEHLVKSRRTPSQKLRKIDRSLTHNRTSYRPMEETVRPNQKQVLQTQGTRYYIVRLPQRFNHHPRSYQKTSHRSEFDQW